MKIFINRLALIAVMLLLGLMIGCSGDDLSGSGSGEDASGGIGSSIDVEGVYDGIMKFTQVEIVYDSDNESDYYNPADDGVESPWLNEETEVSFTFSLDGDKMVLSANDVDDEDLEGTDLVGTYEAANKKFIYVYPVAPGMKDGVMTLMFYEEDGTIKARGENIQEHIETGWTNIISIELTKRADE